MKTLIKTVEVSGEEENSQSFFLDYYLLEKEVQFEEFCGNRYGIEIRKRAKRTNGTPYLEYRKFFDLFHTADEACEMLELMARNTVTPISMKDILEDFLGIGEFKAEEFFVEEAV